MCPHTPALLPRTHVHILTLVGQGVSGHVVCCASCLVLYALCIMSCALRQAATGYWLLTLVHTAGEGERGVFGPRYLKPAVRLE